jgi:hypothetical protein
MLETQKRKSAAPTVLVDGVGCVLHDRCPDSGTALGGVSVIPRRAEAAWSSPPRCRPTRTSSSREARTAAVRSRSPDAPHHVAASVVSAAGPGQAPLLGSSVWGGLIWWMSVQPGVDVGSAWPGHPPDPGGDCPARSVFVHRRGGSLAVRSPSSNLRLPCLIGWRASVVVRPDAGARWRPDPVVPVPGVIGPAVGVHVRHLARAGPRPGPGGIFPPVKAHSGRRVRRRDRRYGGPPGRILANWM